MIGLRLKQMTKELDLTTEQQGKVKALLDEEGKEAEKINDDPNLSLLPKTAKVRELRKETYAKIKSLLEPAQMEKFEAMLRKSERRKKTN